MAAVDTLVVLGTFAVDIRSVVAGIQFARLMVRIVEAGHIVEAVADIVDRVARRQKYLLAEVRNCNPLLGKIEAASFDFAFVASVVVFGLASVAFAGIVQDFRKLLVVH